jgi:hypothetical protein
MSLKEQKVWVFMGAKMYNDCAGKDQQQITALGSHSAVIVSH